MRMFYDEASIVILLENAGMLYMTAVRMLYECRTNVIRLWHECLTTRIRLEYEYSTYVIQIMIAVLRLCLCYNLDTLPAVVYTQG